jgi:oxygen-independent coproporphyrinogen-3 oxidase
METLKKEIALIKEHLDPKRRVSQIHYGGGTPNAIDSGLIEDLNEFLFSNFQFIDNPEIAIECNPAYLDWKYLEALIKAKFNRFSLGIQDFNEKVTASVNRESSAIPVKNILSFLRNNIKEANVNLDFIYGLPGQTMESFSETIQKAIEIKPDRIVTFSYAHVPWLKKHQVVLEKMGLPSPGEKMKMFLSAYDLLKEAGYYSVGLDHYVLPHDELFLAIKEKKLHRNFQGYCTRRTTGQVYAFGVSAISQLEKGYSQNTKDIKQYIAALDKGHLAVEKGCRISDADSITRQIITELMCNKQIDWKEQAEILNITLQTLKSTIRYNEEGIKSFAEDGLLRYSPDEIQITETGSLFIRNIAASFDPAYRQHVNMYSKSV